MFIKFKLAAQKLQFRNGEEATSAFPSSAFPAFVNFKLQDENGKELAGSCILTNRRVYSCLITARSVMGLGMKHLML